MVNRRDLNLELRVAAFVFRNRVSIHCDTIKHRWRRWVRRTRLKGYYRRVVASIPGIHIIGVQFLVIGLSLLLVLGKQDDADAVSVAYASTFSAPQLMTPANPRSMFSPQEPEARDSSAPETVRSFMVNWVMEHADSRVTRTQAERIVAEVYKTEHPMLLLAIFKKESQFWHRAKSYADCRGLGQVNPIHLAELKAAGIVRDIDDLYRIGPNVRASDFVLRQKLAMAKGNNLKAFDLYLSERSESYRAAVVDAYVELSSGVFRLQGGLDERERRNG